MRKLILSILLATSVAMPAMAQDRDGRRHNRGEQNASEPGDDNREARRADRAEQQRPQENDRVEQQRSQEADRAARQARRDARQQTMQAQGDEQQVMRRRGVDQQSGERRDWGQRRSNDDGMAAAIERQQAAARAREQGQVVDPREQRDWRGRGGSTIGRAIDRNGRRDGQFVPQHDRDDRAGSRYAGSDRRWSHHWRGDRHYDWRNYRNRNRSIFRLGNYWDPYGSSYRRFSIGFSLFPNYYQSNNWLNDPWMYRLPPAYGPYRWVRYYDDALLVNVYTGQVVDVEYNFFW